MNRNVAAAVAIVFIVAIGIGVYYGTSWVLDHATGRQLAVGGLVVLVIFGGAVEALRPKRCSRCGTEVSGRSVPGQRCPSCGARWLFER